MLCILSGEKNPELLGVIFLRVGLYARRIVHALTSPGRVGIFFLRWKYRPFFYYPVFYRLKNWSTLKWCCLSHTDEELLRKSGELRYKAPKTPALEETNLHCKQFWALPVVLISLQCPRWHLSCQLLPLMSSASMPSGCVPVRTLSAGVWCSKNLER